MRRVPVPACRSGCAVSPAFSYTYTPPPGATLVGATTGEDDADGPTLPPEVLPLRVQATVSEARTASQRAGGLMSRSMIREGVAQKENEHQGAGSQANASSARASAPADRSS